MDCIFCRIVAGTIPAHMVYEDDEVVAFLDILPATRGHTLVIPRNHAPDLETMEPDDLATVARATQVVARLLRTKLQSDGLNVQQNNGAAAGQEVFHYHVHLLPRWNGDGGARLSRRGATDHAALAELAAQLRS